MAGPEDIEGAIGAAHEAVTADAAAEEASPSGGGGQSICANCSQALTGRYCSSCGQLADSFHRPLWSLITDGLDSLFSLEGRLFRTVPPLLFRPGRVSHAYLSGARARYMAPFRLFLFVSVIFFIVIFAAAGDITVSAPSPPSEEELAELRSTMSDVENRTARAGIGAAITGLETSQSSDEQEGTLSFSDRFKCALRGALLPDDMASAECSALAASGDQDVEVDTHGALLDLPHAWRVRLVMQLEAAIDDPSAWISAMQRWAPRLVFFLFPLYALLLAFTHFWRRDVFVYDHVVVSLHFHTFLFILLLFALGASQILPTPIVFLVAAIWSNFTLYRTLRLVYADSRFGAITRLVLLDVAYLFVLAMALLALVALGVAFV